MRHLDDFEKFSFSTISQKKSGHVGGGSNDLFLGQKSFSELFMIFVHKIKKSTKILKKVGNMVHPNIYIYS